MRNVLRGFYGGLFCYGVIWAGYLIGRFVAHLTNGG